MSARGVAGRAGGTPARGARRLVVDRRPADATATGASRLGGRWANRALGRRGAVVLVAGLTAVWMLAAAGPAGAAAGVPNFSHSPLVADLPGVFGYLTNSDNYESGGTQILGTVSASGAGQRVLLKTVDITIGLLCFSPDGRQVAYFRGGTSSAKVDVMTLATRQVTTPFVLSKGSGFVTGLTWAAGGTELIVGSTNPPRSGHPHKESALWVVPALGGTATRITPFEDAGSPTTAPNGDIVFVVSKTYSSTSGYHKSTLYVANPDGSDPRLLTASSGFIDSPSVSPDGTTIIYSVTSSEVTSHLEAIAATGGPVRSLTPKVSGRSDILPVWSPDGTHIAFLSSRAGRYDTDRQYQLLDAYVMGPTGQDVTKVIWFRGSKASLDLVAWGPLPAPTG